MAPHEPPVAMTLPELTYYQLRAAQAELALAQHEAQQQALVWLQNALQQARQTYEAAVQAACAPLLNGQDPKHYRIDLESRQLIRLEGSHGPTG